MVSKPFVLVVLSYGFGILLGPHIRVPFDVFCLLCISFLAVAFCASRLKGLSTIMLVCAFMSLGLIRAQEQQLTHKNHISHVAKYYRGRPMSVKGIVSSDVERKKFFKADKMSFAVDVKEVRSPWGWRKREGKILVHVFQDIDVCYGDHLLLTGTLHAPYNFSPTEKFSYEEYLARKGIQFILSVKKETPVSILGRRKGHPVMSVLYAARNRFKKVLSVNLSENEAGIMRAILLGDRSQMPRHIKSLFARTGTAHVLAISGLHVGIVAGLFFLVWKLFPINIQWQYVLTILFVIFYVFITGARPSVIRASIMTVVFLAGFLVERESNGLNSLALAGLIILLISPGALFDVGFQMSFLSVFSILTCYSFLFNRLSFALRNISEKRLGRLFIRVFSVSFSAWIGVAGLVMYYFEIVTPISIVGNFFVVPLMTIVVSLGAGLLVAGMVMPVAAFMFANCIKVVLNVMAAIIFILEKVPGAYFVLRGTTLRHVGIYYSVVVFVVLSFWFWGRIQKERSLDFLEIRGA